MSENGSCPPHVADGTVDVWAVRVADSDPRGRRDASRLALRTLLGRYLDRDPGQLTFIHGAFGKPRLAELIDEEALHFSLSRSGDRCLIAVTRVGAVGVDVERCEPFADLEGVAARLFSPAEAARVATTVARHRTGTFYDCWTRKEAYVKATGTGVNMPFDGSGDETAWSIRSLRPWPGFVAAVAVRPRRTEPALTMRHLDLR